MAEFSDTVREFCTDPKFRSKFLFPDRATYELICEVLRMRKGEVKEDVHGKLKQRIQSTWVLHMENGTEKILSREGKHILLQEDLPGLLNRVHDQKGHIGRDATLFDIQSTCHYVPRALVEAYLKRCTVCSSRTALPKPKTGRPIVANGVMERVQADCIDMRSNRDGDFSWILQVKDHCSKFIWAFPMTSKSCANVATRLREIFYSFGPPKILQTDNGGEFIGKELKTLLSDEFKTCTHVFYT